MRLIVGSELEAAAKAPAVIAYPARIHGRLAVAGFAERGTRLLLNSKPVTIDSDGRFERLVSPEELAAGLSWEAERTGARKRWQWPRFSSRRLLPQAASFLDAVKRYRFGCRTD
jgi:uncharacterized protein YfaP (DUF2135 family)